MVHRNVAFVHVPTGQEIDVRIWQARGIMLRILGWRGTMALCPMPLGQETSPLPLQHTDPILRVVRSLGCQTAHGTMQLDPSQDPMFAEAGHLATAGMTVHEWSVAVNRIPGGLLVVRRHMEAILARVFMKMQLVPVGGTLFVASPHAWLLLALVNQLIDQHRTLEHERVLTLDVNAFPGIAIVDNYRWWRGFLDLNPHQHIDWYLQRMP